MFFNVGFNLFDKPFLAKGTMGTGYKINILSCVRMCKADTHAVFFDMCNDENQEVFIFLPVRFFIRMGKDVNIEILLLSTEESFKLDATLVKKKGSGSALTITHIVVIIFILFLRAGKLIGSIVICPVRSVVTAEIVYFLICSHRLTVFPVLRR